MVHEAFGSASLPDARPMTPETVFDLASLTKPLVGATVTLALVDRGLFSLDEEVTDFLPELESFRAKGVTIRRLLAHTAGVTGWRPVYVSASGPAEVLRAIDRIGLASAPGSRFEYSDLGYMTLGLALERAAGKPLPDLLAELVVGPCGLERTGYLPAFSEDQYAVTEEGNAFERRMAVWAGMTSPAGARPSIPVRSTTATRTTGSVESAPTPACSPPPSRSGCSARCGCAMASATVAE